MSMKNSSDTIGNQISNYVAANILVRMHRPALISTYTGVLQHHLMKILCVYHLVLVNWNLWGENMGKITSRREAHGMSLMSVS
jgi:hypothetical protein